jgi:hypothetical protein
MDPADQASLDGWHGSQVFESLFAELQANCGAVAQFPTEEIEKVCDTHEVTVEQRKLALATFSDPEKITEAWTKLQLAAYTEHFLKQAETKPMKKPRRQSLLGGGDCAETSGGSYGYEDYGSSTGGFGGDHGGGGDGGGSD